MQSRGVVNLPLHGGKAPKWLFNRMVKLTEGVIDVMLYEYDSDEFLRRISDPYWFQAFSCVLGFDLAFIRNYHNYVWRSKNCYKC